MNYYSIYCSSNPLCCYTCVAHEQTFARNLRIIIKVVSFKYNFKTAENITRYAKRFISERTSHKLLQLGNHSQKAPNCMNSVPS